MFSQSIRLFMNNTVFKAFLVVLISGYSLSASAFDRKQLVRRHNPSTTFVGRQQYPLGQSKLHIKVDATALQTFVPDQNLGLNIGLNLADTTQLTDLHMTLDRWAGKADSHFRHRGQYYHVETVCSPFYQFNWQMDRPTFSTRITSDTIFEVELRPIQFATDYNETVEESKLSITQLKHHAAVRILNTGGGANTYRWFAVSWRGNASMKKRGNLIVLRCKGDNVTIEGKKTKVYSLDITMSERTSMPSDAFFNNENIAPFTEFALHTATGWNMFWMECGLADFSQVQHPQAKQLEGRMVEALYQMTATTPADWWTTVPYALYGFPKEIVNRLAHDIANHPDKIYLRPELIATAYLLRQGYTHPIVAKRFDLSTEEVAKYDEIVVNAYGDLNEKAAAQLRKSDDNDEFLPPSSFLSPRSSRLVPPVRLSRKALLDIAERWPHLLTEPLPDDTYIFCFPPLSDLLAMPSGKDTDMAVLLMVAARQWPEDWNVTVENILPIQGNKVTR